MIVIVWSCQKKRHNPKWIQKSLLFGWRCQKLTKLFFMILLVFKYSCDYGRNNNLNTSRLLKKNNTVFPDWTRKILDNNSLITIGSHSHNHLNLKILSNDEILYEVKKSLGILENLLGHKVKHFSYPYGEKNQDSSQKYNIIENLSFDSAVTAKAYPIKNYNLFSLPRIYVGQNTCEKAIINHLRGFYNLTNRFF